MQNAANTQAKMLERRNERASISFFTMYLLSVLCPVPGAVVSVVEVRLMRPVEEELSLSCVVSSLCHFERS